MLNYKELRFYQSSKVDVGVLLKSVFHLAERGISNPKVTTVTVKRDGNLIKVSHIDQYGHVLEFGLVRIVIPNGDIHFKLNYLHSYYVENPSNVLSVRLEVIHALDSDVHFRFADTICFKIYKESPVLLNYVLSSVEDFFKSSLCGASAFGKAKQEYTLMYNVQSNGKWSVL